MKKQENESIHTLVQKASLHNLNGGGIGEIRVCDSCPDKEGWHVVGFSDVGFDNESEVVTVEVRLDHTDPTQLQLRDAEGADVWTVRATAYNLCRFLTGCD